MELRTLSSVLHRPLNKNNINTNEYLLITPFHSVKKKKPTEETTNDDNSWIPQL